MNNSVEIIEKQNGIIRAQSEIIDELYRLLIQHITVEEFCSAPVCGKMKAAADDIRSIQ